MKAIGWLGILLIVFGALALIHQWINYTRQKQVFDLGSVQVSTETHERVPVTPILGGQLAVVGGVILLVLGAGNKS